MGEPNPSPRADAPARDWFVIGVRAVVVVVVVAGWGAYFVSQHGWDFPLLLLGDKTFRAPAAAGLPVTDAVAYVTPEGEVRVMEMRRGRSWRVGRTDAPNSALTWSHDGRYLAYLELYQRGGESLVLAPTDREESRVFHRDPRLNPVYFAWSPDDSELALLCQEQGEMALRVVPIGDPGNARRMGGAPSCYFNWRPGGGALLANMGNARLTVFDTRTGAEDQVEPGAFMSQTPAWPEDDVFYYLASNGGRSEFRRTNAETLESEPLAEGPWSCRAVASPDGRYLGYLDMPISSFMPMASRRPGTTHVLNIATGEDRSVPSDLTLAFFWSPDSTKLMLVSRVGGLEPVPTADVEDQLPSIGQREGSGMRWHRWWLYDLATGECTALVQCRMSRGFLRMLPFFDQYAHSHRYWSPDSRYFVIAARQHEEHPGDVWVLDTTGENPPRKLAEGGFAVWSWQ